jgi:hypothetical protein
MTRLALLLLLLGSARLLFPGDVPFVNDEPMLVERALDANASGSAAVTGLLGTRGARYGPAPVWFYQTALAFTHDLPTVVLARTALVTLLTGAALLLLARSLGRAARSSPILAPALGAFAFLSPYLWFYARDLWDNSFAIPLSGMLLASYVAYLKEGRVGWLALAGLFGALCFLTHLMTLPLVAAVAIHFLATRWRALHEPRFALVVATIVVGCVVLCLPYLRSVGGGSMAGFRLLPSPASVVFALGGLRVFTLAGFDYFVGEWGAWGSRGSGVLAVLAVGVSLFSWVAGAVGVAAWGRDAFREVPKVFGGGGVACGDGGGGRLEGSVGLLLLLALALFVLLVNGLRLREHPHYYNGVWAVFFLFWWRGMTVLAVGVAARRVLAVQVAAMALFLSGVTGTVHAGRGLKALHYGPTLSNQMEVARALEREGLEIAQPSEVLHVRMFPHAIGVIRRLERGEAPEPGAGVLAGHAEVVYVAPEGIGGAIALGAAPTAAGASPR